MRAALIRGWTRDPEWSDVDPPRGQGDEVLVEIEVAALNRLDIVAADGVLGTDWTLPYVGGVEGCGLVVDGPDAGRRVLVRGGQVGLGRAGCWAEVVSAPREAVLPLPDDLDPWSGATFFQPTCAAYLALHDVAAVEHGDVVIVVGAAGAVGSQLVQQALLIGASVIGVVGHDEQLGRVPSGAHAISVRDHEAVTRLAAKRDASAMFDTLGGRGLTERIGWVKPGGCVVPIGYLAGHTASLDIPTWLMSDVRLLPMNMLSRDARAREIAPALAERVRRRELYVDLDRYEPTRIVEALHNLRAGLVRGRAVMAIRPGVADR